jgi:hypothetical protein
LTHPPLTSGEVRDLADGLEAAANWMQRYLDTFGELGDDATQANIDDWHDTAKKGRLTAAQPSSTGVEDWKSDPSSDERWNAGADFVMLQLCHWLYRAGKIHYRFLQRRADRRGQV